jgi:hypothetical protein
MRAQILVLPLNKGSQNPRLTMRFSSKILHPIGPDSLSQILYSDPIIGRLQVGPYKEFLSVKSSF